MVDKMIKIYKSKDRKLTSKEQRQIKCLIEFLFPKITKDEKLFKEILNNKKDTNGYEIFLKGEGFFNILQLIANNLSFMQKLEAKELDKEYFNHKVGDYFVGEGFP